MTTNKPPVHTYFETLALLHTNDNFSCSFPILIMVTPMNGIGCYPLLTIVTVESVQCYI